MSRGRGRSRTVLAATLAVSIAAGVATGLVAPIGSAAHASELGVRVAGSAASLGVTSLKEARFQTVIRQQYDFSCGSAALATLLTYHYGRPITEAQAFQAMYEVGDQETIQKYGFSLLDMKRFLNSVGLRADGFRVPLDKLAQANVPAITLINTKGYKHFVVVKGVRDDVVMVGDPALGMQAIPRDEFEQMWEGVAFIIRDDLRLAQRNFNREDEWRLHRKAPFGDAIDRKGLAGFSMGLPAFNEF